jgi:hypothetical protein
MQKFIVYQRDLLNYTNNKRLVQLIVNQVTFVEQGFGWLHIDKQEYQHRKLLHVALHHKFACCILHEDAIE